MAIINHKGKYRVVIYLGKDTDGKEVRKTKVFEKLKDARDWEKSFQSSDVGSNSLSPRLLVNDAVPIFLEFIKEEHKGKTFTGYKSDLDSKFLPYFNYWQINKISPQDLENFKLSLKNLNISTSTINRAISSTKSFFDWACNNPNSGMFLTVNPARGLKQLKILSRDSKIKYWNTAEIKLFLKEIKMSPYGDLFIFLLNTGLRINEALGLTVEDYIASNAILDVHTQLDVYIPMKSEPVIDRAFVLSPLKTTNPRKIALNSIAANILGKRIKDKKSTDFIFETVRKNKSDLRPVVFQRGSSPYVVDSFCISYMNFHKDVFLSLVKKSKIKNIGIHGLRHTFASHFMMNGGDLFTLSKILGHKSIKTTEIYAHLSSEFLAGSRNVVSIGED